MQIRIVWEKDKPYFVSDDKKGDCIFLNFGMEYVDDIEIASEKFFVFLQNDVSGWKAKIDTGMSHGIIHGDLIRELTIKIDQALEVRGMFDIAGYVMSNKKDYAFFSFMACWINRYRPKPAGIKPG